MHLAEGTLMYGTGIVHEDFISGMPPCLYWVTSDGCFFFDGSSGIKWCLVTFVFKLISKIVWKKFSFTDSWSKINWGSNTMSFRQWFGLSQQIDRVVQHSVALTGFHFKARCLVFALSYADGETFAPVAIFGLAGTLLSTACALNTPSFNQFFPLAPAFTSVLVFLWFAGLVILYSKQRLLSVYLLYCGQTYFRWYSSNLCPFVCIL